MNLKSQVLNKLEKNRGTFISGNEMSKEFFVSRNAVWKAIKSLKDDGYSIASVTNKGYMLSLKTDILSVEGISKYLEYPLKVKVYDEIESTNKCLKELATNGAKEGTVIVSKMQTSGRGRLGKSFYSPDDTGSYFSILLKPKISAEDSLKLTVMAAVAVAKTVEKYSNSNVQIKWVNDIYVDSKKVCGILTEGSISMENGGLDYAIVGIGINILPPKNGFPNDIKNIATSIFTNENIIEDAKNKITADILNNFIHLYKSDSIDYINDYRNRSYLNGKPINIIRFDETIPATAVEIDKNCHLVVKMQDGKIQTLSSGDVSVRII